MSNLREVLNTWDNADSELNKKIDNTNLSTIVASATASVSNSKTVEINGTGKNVEKLVVEGKTVQDGTPSPDNPIEVKGVGDYDEETGKYKIPISVGDTTKNVYLDAPLFDGEKADVVSGVADKKYAIKVFDGSENWSVSGSESMDFALAKFVPSDIWGYYDVLGFSNKYVSISQSSSWTTYDNVIAGTGNGDIFLKDSRYARNETDLAKFKADLATNPLVLIYKIKPTKETFDGAELPTSVGKNILSVDTDVIPAKVEAVTFGDYYSKAEVDKMVPKIEYGTITSNTGNIDTAKTFCIKSGNIVTFRARITECTVDRNWGDICILPFKPNKDTCSINIEGGMSAVWAQSDGTIARYPTISNATLDINGTYITND